LVIIKSDEWGIEDFQWGLNNLFSGVNDLLGRVKFVSTQAGGGSF